MTDDTFSLEGPDVDKWLSRVFPLEDDVEADTDTMDAEVEDECPSEIDLDTGPGIDIIDDNEIDDF